MTNKTLGSILLANNLSILSSSNLPQGLSYIIAESLHENGLLSILDANFLIMPWVLEFNSVYVAEKVTMIGKAMGINVDELNVYEGSMAVVKKLAGMCRKLITPSLCEVSIPRDSLGFIADEVLRKKSVHCNPRPVFRQDVLNLLYKSFFYQKNRFDRCENLLHAS